MEYFMRANYKIYKVSLVLTIISIGVLFYLEFLSELTNIGFYTNILLAIFGSSLLTCITTLIMFKNELKTRKIEVLFDLIEGFKVYKNLYYSISLQNRDTESPEIIDRVNQRIIEARTMGKMSLDQAFRKKDYIDLILFPDAKKNYLLIYKKLYEYLYRLNSNTDLIVTLREKNNDSNINKIIEKWINNCLQNLNEMEQLIIEVYNKEFGKLATLELQLKLT